MKTEPVQTVVHDWVATLPFTQQALLFTAMRGPDNCPKENSAKPIIHYLRGVVMKPAYPGFDESRYQPDTFMCDMVCEEDFRDHCKMFLKDHDAFPHHFIMHLIHAAAVVGYGHLNGYVSALWLCFYYDCCKAMHMHPESADQLYNRLQK